MSNADGPIPHIGADGRDGEPTGNPRAPGIWSGQYRTLTLAVVTVMSINAFEGLAVVGALAEVGRDLGHVSLLPWVLTSYLAAFSIAVVASGPIIDGIGVRRTFRLGVSVLIVTTVVVCGAPTMLTLVIARAAQGLGAGLAGGVITTTIGLAYPNRLRPAAFAAVSLVWGVMGLGGPVLIGPLLSVAHWRVLFLVQLPIMGAAAMIGWSRFPSQRSRAQWPRLDWLGIALLTVCVVATLVGASWLGRDWATLGFAFAIGGGAGLLYAVHSGRSDRPVLARRFVVGMPMGYINAAMGLVLVAGLGIESYLPLYLQGGRDRSVGVSATAVVFVTVGWTVGSFVFSKVLAQLPYARVIAGGAVAMTSTLLVAALLIGQNTRVTVIYAAFFAIGVCIGVTSGAVLTLVPTVNLAAELGRANAAHEFVRTLSATIGIALAGAVILSTVQQRTGDVEMVRQMLQGDDVEGRPGEPLTLIGDAIAVGFGRFAWLGAVLSGCAVVAALALGRVLPSRGSEAISSIDDTAG